MAVRYPASLKLAVAHSEAGVADFELERPWMVTLLEIKLEIAKRLVDEHGQLLLATEEIDYLQLYSDTSHTLATESEHSLEFTIFSLNCTLGTLCTRGSVYHAYSAPSDRSSCTPTLAGPHRTSR